MATVQFGRKVSLIVGREEGDALDLSGLRITFRVSRTDQQTPNSADIRIYNVSGATTQRIGSEFKRVVLQAGYEGNFGIIFDGTIKQVKRGGDALSDSREAPQTDTCIDISAADGDVAYNHAVVNTTLAAGSSAADHVAAACAAMNPFGVTQGYVPTLPGNRLARGKAMFGMARDVMRTAAQTTDTLWSIQDGKLIMVPETSYLPDEVYVINARTGMTGKVEQASNGTRVRMLLNPRVRIGRLLRIDHARQPQLEAGGKAAATADDGYYYVARVEHRGDTRGNDYYTEATCLKADATRLAAAANQRGTPPADGAVKARG